MRRRKRTICEKQHAALRTLGLTLLAVALCASQSNADTTQVETWNVGATCQPNDEFPCFAQNFSAVFTTQMMTGTFDSTDTNLVFDGTEPVIISMTGTLDGMPISMVPLGMPLDWLNNGAPEGVDFMAGGQQYALVSDISTVLLVPAANDNAYEFLAWDPPEPMSIPEPSELIMLLGGLDALLIAAWFRRKS